MPSRRHTSATWVSTRGSAAVFAQQDHGLKQSFLVPPIEKRGSVWSGWCPRISDELCAMNPLAFGGVTEEFFVQAAHSVHH